MRLVDIYAGIGGGSLGARQAGMEPVFAFETDINAQMVFSNNFGFPPAGDPALVDSRAITHPDIVFAAPTRELLMAMNMRTTIEALRPRAIVVEMPAREAVLMQFTSECMRDLGYKVWFDRLNAADYGLPQVRIRNYAVCIRNDIKLFFSSFPFPDRLPGMKLAAILDEKPDPGLFVGEDVMEKTVRRNMANESAGVGFVRKTLTPNDLALSLPLNYYKNKQAMLVDQGSGPRRLSVIECKRLMGFPDDWSMPVSDTEAFRLLASATCPPVAGRLLKEVADWISF